MRNLREDGNRRVCAVVREQVWPRGISKEVAWSFHERIRSKETVSSGAFLMVPRVTLMAICSAYD